MDESMLSSITCVPDLYERCEPMVYGNYSLVNTPIPSKYEENFSGSSSSIIVVIVIAIVIAVIVLVVLWLLMMKRRTNNMNNGKDKSKDDNKDDNKDTNNTPAPQIKIVQRRRRYVVGYEGMSKEDMNKENKNII